MINSKSLLIHLVSVRTKKIVHLSHKLIDLNFDLKRTLMLKYYHMLMIMKLIEDL